MKTDGSFGVLRTWLGQRAPAAWFWGGAGAAALAAVVALAARDRIGGSDFGPTYTVRKGTFETRIVESGTLAALENVVVTGEISGGRAKIVKLVPDGSMVQAGDLLVEFDRAAIVDEIGRTRREVERARAELVNAEEDLKTERARIEQSLRLSTEAARVAELELRNQKEAVGPLRLKRTEAELNKAKAEYEKRAADFTDFEALLKQNYVSQPEMERARIKMSEAKNAYDFAQTEYDNLVKFAQPAETAAAQARLQAERDNLEKTKETAQYRVKSKAAAIKKAEADLESLRYQLGELEQQLGKTVMRAPIAGFVIHAFVGAGAERRKLQTGDSVDYNQEILRIPNTNQLLVDTQIREVDIHRVEVGQGATVRVDAFPDLTLAGKVQLIGTLAAVAGARAEGERFFTLKVLLDGSDARLRPGMTARVEILTDQRHGTLLIPVDAVFDRGGRRVVYRLDGQIVEERDVRIDQANPDFVIVNAGLSEGDTVLLTDPTRRDRTTVP
jgi:HlyD family secretion protein